MEDSKRYFRLGVFVVVAITLLAGVLFILGGRSLFQPKFTFETYFKESVSGLEVGAPVELRGVPLGGVSAILTSSSVYERDLPIDKRKTYIVVRATISYDPNQTAQIQRDVSELVKRGLRAQTQLAGVTGQQYLALDYFDPEKYPPLPFDWRPEYQYVPSAPSLASEIIANAQEFLASLNEADITQIGQNLNKLLVTADTLVSQARSAVERVDETLATAPISEAVQKLESAATRLDELLARPGLTETVDNLGEVSKRLRTLAASGDLDRMVTSLAQAADRLDGVIADNQYDVRVIVEDLRVTANNLRALSETIKRDPSGALLGGPPEKVKLPARSR